MFIGRKTHKDNRKLRKFIFRMYMRDSKVNYIREMENIKYDRSIDQEILDSYNFRAK